MNMTRHLQVPNQDVGRVCTQLKSNNWLANGMLIFASEDGKNRLIPLNLDSPESMPNNLQDFKLINCEGKTDQRINPDWLSHLSPLIDREILERYNDLWPSSHELIGDMMIVRLDDKILSYAHHIAQAKLSTHPKLRLILSDQGVLGELRIRELIPIGARYNDEIILHDIPKRLCGTKAIVRESGREIICDPSKAYFSTKLQTERQETLFYAKELRKILGRPVNVCDPFCGVGPAVSSLLMEPILVGKLLASDLNPDAITILFENLTKWDKRKYPVNSKTLDWVHSDRLVGKADATKISINNDFINKWDLMLINLPHKTMELLPCLIPLLDTSTPSLIRGRVLIEETKIEITNTILCTLLPKLLPGSAEPSLKIKRDYSAKLKLCSFEAWLA